MNDKIKKKHTARNVILGISAVIVLTFVGCAALVGGAANEIDKSIKAGESEQGGTNNPVIIKEGVAFDVRNFSYAKGWKIKNDDIDMLEITGLKVTNNRDKRDSVVVEIKVWQGSEILATSNCTTEPIMPKTTTKVDCMSADKLPSKYGKVTINDAF